MSARKTVAKEERAGGKTRTRYMEKLESKLHNYMKTETKQVSDGGTQESIETGNTATKEHSQS